MTTARWEACERNDGCLQPEPVAADWRSGWGTNRSPERLLHPQNGVSWLMAEHFCSTIGGRLPSEAEWEYAAKGPVHRRFPWGDEPEADCERAILGLGGHGCGASGTWEVTAKPAGTSYFGALGMAGNLWEWVQDCWHGRYDEAPADGSAWADQCVGVDSRVLRGGCYAIQPAEVRSARRITVDRRHESECAGVRCARDLP